MNKGYKYHTKNQSRHIDLLSKSEIFDHTPIYYNAKGVTFLGGGLFPQKTLKNLRS